MPMPRPLLQEVAPVRADDFSALFRQHGADVARWAAALGGPLLEIEDAVQEVFMVAHRRLSEFRGDAKVTTWLFQITRRVVLGQRRRARWRRWLRGSAEDVAGHLATSELGPVEVFERREAARRLYEVLDRMNEKYRMVLVLTKMEGLDADQIARVSGVSPVTVRVWLHRARAQFQQLALEGGA
ncbi:MAG TPA: sigma-70 family RNA polymerase sigma factor [Polyangia bacterium]|jgi:RNA polymerase sigma-70 factor (ECF subfamily)|nr:sigma-70 family RNA polymerase sigma factor [Polyangia bacterium]